MRFFDERSRYSLPNVPRAKPVTFNSAEKLNAHFRLNKSPDSPANTHNRGTAAIERVINYITIASLVANCIKRDLILAKRAGGFSN